MSAIQSFCEIFGINKQKFLRQEKVALEALLISHICKEIIETSRLEYRNYFQFMKFTKTMENTMLEDNLLQFIIKDLLKTQEYTIEGLACYAATHEDVIFEIITGKNTNSSEKLLRRMLSLHQIAKKDFYQEIFQKLLNSKTL